MKSVEGDTLMRFYRVELDKCREETLRQKARADAAEACLTQSNARILEMGRLLMGVQGEVTRLQVVIATLEPIVRAQVADAVATETDNAYQNKVRELSDWMQRRHLGTKPLSKQDEQDLKDIVLAAVEEFRMIVRRGLPVLK
jgi:hypothetical protein